MLTLKQRKSLKQTSSNLTNPNQEDTNTHTNTNTHTPVVLTDEIHKLSTDIFQNGNYPKATRQFTRFGLFDRDEPIVLFEQDESEFPDE